MVNSWILIIFFLPICGAAADVQLSLEQCIEIALDQNPMTRAASAGVAVASAEVGIAAAPYYPEANFRMYGGRFQQHIFFPKINAPIAIPSIVGPIDDFSLHVRSKYILWDSGERRARLHAAQAHEAAAFEEVEKIRQEIILNVSLAYYGLLANEEQLAYSNKNLERTQQHFKTSYDRKLAGDVPLADVLRTQVEVSNAKQSVAHAESLVRISKGNLNTAMGLPPESCLCIVHRGRRTQKPDNEWLTEANAHALSYRPEIHAAYDHLLASEETIEISRSAFGPRFVAEGTYGHRDDQFFPRDEEWSLGISMEIPIFRGFALQNQLRRSQADFCREQAEYDRLVLAIRQEVWDAYSRLVEAYESTVTSVSLLEFATESLRMADERYKMGAGTITDLIDAQTALKNAESTFVDAHWNYQAALTRFTWTQGLL